MIKKSIYVLITLIVFANVYILSYKYSFYSDIIYKANVYSQEKDNLVIIEKEIKVEEKNYAVLDSYEGTMTAYGADCYGCSGITASGYDIRNDNIYFQDEKFGKIRIVAADSSVPFGTVVRISGVKIYEEPFFAIVLDRGYLIKGKIMDLAFGFQDEEDVKKVGRSEVLYEVLRYGW